MKAPALQWYPGDWLRDLALQACSLRARGLWIEMINLMHDGVPYGHLSTEAGPISPRKLAQMLHASGQEVSASLRELGRHGVYSRTPEGVIYSRRMVRDESLRNQRRDWGKLGGHDHETAVAYGKRGGRPRGKGVSNNGVKGVSKNHLDGGYTKTPPASASASAEEKTEEKTSSRKVTPPPWTTTLPFPALPQAWWQETLALFPGLDHEAVARDAAAYWTDHRGKYRDVGRFLRNQFGRAFSRRPSPAEADPYSALPCAWECPTCGGVHEGPRDGPRPPCPTAGRAAEASRGGR
jgi:hypothetical protein